MKHALARGLTYAEHMRTISSRELAEWYALASLEPIFDRGDYHAAQICTTIAAIMSKHPPKFGDFLLKFEQAQSPRQTDEEQKAIAKALHAMFQRRKVR